MACHITGGGKSALFGIPILVHHEISGNPTLYPKFSVCIRERAVGIVITPTKGLANDILGIEGFAYTHKNITAQQKISVNIVKEIISCCYSVICVDPEHLREREWYLIANSPSFRENVIFACAEEGHVINEWGLSFHPLFRHIGMFFRGRLPSHISVFSLTATMQLGEPLHLLITYLNQRRKTIIHVRTIDLGYRIFLYLFKHSPKDSHCLRCFRMYNSLVSDKYNKRTIDLLDSDPFFQAAIATKALSLGVHAKSVMDSVSVGGSDTQDESEQSGIAAGEVSVSAIARLKPSELLSSKSKKTRPLDPAKVVYYAETFCHVACGN
ncbi:hypothetical protein BT96DRAFT_968543 [Gymnopus androsaceus JB14]|uniref:DEAD/DEAH-box helicase domain-containing protein n=1 Tax=Gymnopus androsaceus JB14 TaxID=1447944 RepID=A0A6A4GFR1_9AGAR|nr:hypothetical protein BT96DRAFT_968543 [Gymnopus androsaceus JB14]